MQVDESGWKRVKVDESGYEYRSREYQPLINIDESGWKWIKVDENGLRI